MIIGYDQRSIEENLLALSTRNPMLVPDLVRVRRIPLEANATTQIHVV